VLNKVDQHEDRFALQRFKIKYPKTVDISALQKTGLTDLLAMMVKEISLLRKTLTLRIPQSQYSLLAGVLKEGIILNTDYDENDIVITLEIPHHLEHKVQHFII
jgi:GTP-binding protein HflX